MLACAIGTVVLALWHCIAMAFINRGLFVQEVKYSSGVRSEKYICWTRKQMRYMLGDHGYSYVVGNNPPNKPGQFPKRVHDRGASCPAPPANCSQVTALYNPQDNPNTITGGLVLVSTPFISPSVDVLGQVCDHLSQLI